MNNPETRFIQSVHRRLKQLPQPPLIRKIADRFTQGWPDVLYISPTGVCLWVEYKIYPNKPTHLQANTCAMLHNYKQKVAIITKTPKSCMIFDGLTTHETNEPWTWITNTLEYTNDHHRQQSRMDTG